MTNRNDVALLKLWDLFELITADQPRQLANNHCNSLASFLLFSGDDFAQKHSILLCLYLAYKQSNIALRNLGTPSRATLLRSAVILQLFCLVLTHLGVNLFCFFSSTDLRGSEVA